MSASARGDPYLGFRFVVQIDSLIAAGFSEVSGLEAELETEEYEEGGLNTHTHSLKTRFTYPNLVLRRGVTASDSLQSWLLDAREAAVERKTAVIFLLDSTGAPARGWSVSGAYPVKWSGPDMRARGGEVAVESLELTHTGVEPVAGI